MRWLRKDEPAAPMPTMEGQPGLKILRSPDELKEAVDRAARTEQRLRDELRPRYSHYGVDAGAGVGAPEEAGPAAGDGRAAEVKAVGSARAKATEEGGRQAEDGVTEPGGAPRLFMLPPPPPADAPARPRLEIVDEHGDGHEGRGFGSGAG